MINIKELSKRLKDNIDELNKTLDDIKKQEGIKVILSEINHDKFKIFASIVKVISTTHGAKDDVWVNGFLNLPDPDDKSP